MNLHAQFMEAPNTADFRLLISVEGPHDNLATVTSISIDDSQLQSRLRDIAQAFRMGARYGQENNTR